MALILIFSFYSPHYKFLQKKRIYTPLLIFVKNGKIIAHHTDTVDSQTNPYVALNDRQSEELLLKLINYMSKISASVCDESC